MKDCDSKKECLGCDCRKKTIAAGAMFLVLVAAAIFLLVRQAQSQPFFGAEWKNFRENTLGISFAYPSSWNLVADYDHYAPGIFSAEMDNKKCAGAPGKCGSECIDLRILAAEKPLDGRGDSLVVQLYEDFMMVRDFSVSPLVAEIDSGSKKVFQVDHGGPTLALNGACAGPLYLFEAGDYFVYVFAGYGDSASGENDKIREIINSIRIGGA